MERIALKAKPESFFPLLVIAEGCRGFITVSDAFLKVDRDFVQHVNAPHYKTHAQDLYPEQLLM